MRSEIALALEIKMEAIGSGWEKPNGDIKQLSGVSGFDRWWGEGTEGLCQGKAKVGLLAEEVTLIYT